MRLDKTLATPTAPTTVEVICAGFDRFGMSPPASRQEFARAHDFAEQLIGGKIASVRALQRVQEHNGASLFLLRENDAIVGFVAIILLSRPGLKAILADRFDAVAPRLAHVSPSNAEPAAAYAWGIAAANHEVAKHLMAALGAAVGGAIPHLAFFGRVATDAGRRLVIDRIGFKPVPGSKTGLLWIEPMNQRRPATAA